MNESGHMETIPFKKLHGAGNDFVFLDAWNNDINVTSEQVQALCDRHFGIGADGVIVVRRPSKAGNAGFMDYINSDGSLAQMCGNGVRCFAKYVVDSGYAVDDGDGIVVETRAGERLILVKRGSDGLVTAATVDMGKPILEPASVPVSLPANAEDAFGEPFVRETAVASPWGDFAFTCVSMGNPHAVCFIDDFEELDDALFDSSESKDLQSFDIGRIGSFFESNPIFPEKANIELASESNGLLHMRVFERGCGETLACGTGACATGVAAYLTGRTGNSVDIALRGGLLHIDYDIERNTVLMTGPAALSFSGSIDI